MRAGPDERRRRRLLMETGAIFSARRERHEGHPSRLPESDRRGRAVRGSAGGLGGRRLRVRCARDAEGAHRHHRAHRLLVHRHGARAGTVQEARHRVHDLQGGVVGGDPRSPHARREPGHPHAPRHALRVHHGPAGLAREADDHPLLPEPQRAGDHAHQGSPDQGRQDAGADQAARARGQGQGTPHDVRDDLTRRERMRCGCATGSRAAASTPTRTCP